MLRWLATGSRQQRWSEIDCLHDCSSQLQIPSRGHGADLTAGASLASPMGICTHSEINIDMG